jgi:acetylornithine deacetylase/succinyl-diaminopimelate desuccinylase-like protein
MDALGMRPAVDLTFVFDGDEEIGSPGFGPFVEAHQDLLRADFALVTDGPKDASERPTVSLGARGILALELTLEAARRDVHSGNVTAPNPAWILVGLLASMAAPDGTPLIEGLEADVVPPTAAERELMGRIPLDLPALERELGVRLPADYLERLMFHSTVTVRGLQSGFVGAQAQTIIPHRATVALDLRLVKNQRMAAVYRRVVEHIRAQGFTVLESPDAPLPDELRGRAVRVVEKHGYDPAKTAVDLPIVREVIATVERAHGGAPAVVLPTSGGSVPLYALTDVLGLPTVLVPYANAGNRQHAPNEHLRLDHLFQGIRTTAQLLTELGG